MEEDFKKKFISAMRALAKLDDNVVEESRYVFGLVRNDGGFDIITPGGEKSGLSVLVIDGMDTRGNAMRMMMPYSMVKKIVLTVEKENGKN